LVVVSFDGVAAGMEEVEAAYATAT